MLRFKRILGLGILAGLLAAAAMAIPAQAGAVKAVCEVVGTAKVTDKDESQYGVRLIGGSGSFDFNSVQLVCSGLNKGQPFVDTYTVRATGTYDSEICGRGKAVGVVGDLVKGIGVGQKNNLEAAVEGDKFAVEFVGGGEGLFFWKGSEYDKESPIEKDMTSPKAPDKAEWDHAGQIELGPPDPGEDGKAPPEDPTQPEGNCTKAFSVSGQVLIDDNGM